MSKSPCHPVSLAAVRWDFPLIGRTRMLTEAWLRAGSAALFVEPAESYRDLLKRALFIDRRRTEPHVIRPGPTRYPVRWWTRMSERRLMGMMRDSANGLRRRLDRILSWKDAAGLVISPMWLPWLDALPFGQIIYDCIDDLAVHAPDPRFHKLYKRWERELIDRCDGAVVTAEVLRDSIRSRCQDLPVTTIRNGVDVNRFRSLALNAPRPRDLPAKDRLIIGFVGALYENEEWIDWDIIGEAARQLSDFEFVFLGPHTGGLEIAGINQFRNVTLLGRRPYDQVPAYINAYHVCWVPFRSNKIVSAANPVKIYEYLALGKPVVSTPFADPESFDKFVQVGRTSEEIVELLREAAGAAEQGSAERVAFARRNSWEARAAAYLDFLNSPHHTPRDRDAGLTLSDEAL